jgi:hypothetical protein
MAIMKLEILKWLYSEIIYENVVCLSTNIYSSWEKIKLFSDWPGQLSKYKDDLNN